MRNLPEAVQNVLEMKYLATGTGEIIGGVKVASILVTDYKIWAAQAEEENRFALLHTESAVFAARLEASAMELGITEENLINSFHLIHQDWYTGET